jgi:hypothetical protein
MEYLTGNVQNFQVDKIVGWFLKGKLSSVGYITTFKLEMETVTFHESFSSVQHSLLMSY